MKGKLAIIFVSMTLLLTACIPMLDRDDEDIIIVEETNNEEGRQYVITPTIDTPENYYRNVLEDGRYARSDARGTVAPYMSNRLDLNQFEFGLMEIATTAFEQDKYFFREGQFLTGDRINSWLRRHDPDVARNAEGLNPPPANESTDEESLRKSPIVLSHIMEHNYLSGNEAEGVQIGGVVIGLSLQSVYYFRTEDEAGRYYFHEQTLDLDKVEEQGKEIAQEVLKRFRGMSGLEEVPISIALYQEQDRGSIVPGSFISMTHVGAGETEIASWEDLDEYFLIFPSSAGIEAHPDIATNISRFTEDIEGFFNRNVGVVGKGRFKGGALEELVIELNLQAHGKAEIVALTQYISGKIKNISTSRAPIYVYVNSVNGQESIVVQYPDQQAFTHIYKN